MCETGKFDNFEENIVREAGKRKTPCVIAVSKTDLKPPDMLCFFLASVETGTIFSML
jgi:hypothetical protein